MEGTLESPPIVLRTSRGVMIFAVAACILFAPVAFWLMARTDATPKAVIVGVLGIVGCSAGVFLGLAKLVRPDRLEISPSGLCYRSLTAHNFDLAWRDIDAVRLWKHRRTAAVVFDLAPQAKGAVRASSTNRMLTGADISLPGGWPIDSEHLMGLLTTAKARWDPG